MKQFVFEWKKILKRKSIWAGILLSMIAVIALAAIHFSAADRVREGLMTKKELMGDQYTVYLAEAKKDKAEAEKAGDQELSDALAYAIENYEHAIENRGQWISDYSSKNFKPLLTEEIEELEMLVSGEGSYMIESQPVRSFTLRASLSEKEWLLENGVDPVVQNSLYQTFLPTIYDEFTGRAQKEWERSTARYEDTGLTYFYRMGTVFLLPVLILTGCFLFGNSVSAENGRKKRGMQLQLIQPVRKSVVFFAKYAAGLLAVIMFTGLLSAVVISSGYFGSGIGDGSYPVLVYEGSEPNPYDSKYNALDNEKDEFHFIPVREYVQKSLMMGLLLTVFIYSLYFLLSLLIRSQVVNSIAVAGIVFAGMKLLPAGAYNPFTYVDVHRMLNGETAALSFKPGIVFQNGLLTLTFASLILFLFCLLSFYAKSRRIAS